MLSCLLQVLEGAGPIQQSADHSSACLRLLEQVRKLLDEHQRNGEESDQACDQHPHDQKTSSVASNRWDRVRWRWTQPTRG